MATEGTSGIKALSLHFTRECNRECANCYMKGREGDAKGLDFFMPFPRACRALGIGQIALGGGEPSLFPRFVQEFGEECEKNGVILNMTTNGDGINEETISAYKGVTLMSFSFDRYKVRSTADAETLFSKMDLAARKGLVVGANVQLDERMIRDLYGVVGEIKRHASNIYLLQPKPDGITPDAGLRTRLLGVSSLFGDVFVDDSLRMRLGFSDSCERGRGIVSVDFAGRVCKCSFDEPFAELERAEDLVGVIRGAYPFEETRECPFCR